MSPVLTDNVSAVMFNVLLTAFIILLIGSVALGVYAAKQLKKAEEKAAK